MYELLSKLTVKSFWDKSQILMHREALRVFSIQFKLQILTSHSKDPRKPASFHFNNNVNMIFEA